MYSCAVLSYLYNILCNITLTELHLFINFNVTLVLSNILIPCTQMETIGSYNDLENGTFQLLYTYAWILRALNILHKCQYPTGYD